MIADDDGFITPVFGVLALAIAIVALAYLQLARSDERSARRDWERFDEANAAQGVVTLAAWSIMHQPDSKVMTWDERTPVGAMRVTVEPEARKLSLNELGSPRGFEKLAMLVGRSEANEITRRAPDVSGSSRIPTRSDVRRLSDNAVWRDCGLSLVSPYSRLTDNALSSGERSQGEFSFRKGEAWRVSVVARRRVALDRVIRFTGDARSPIAVIDVLSPPGVSPAEGCVFKFMRPTEGAE